MDKHLFFENALGANNSDWIRLNSLLVKRIGLKEAVVLKQLLHLQNEHARKRTLDEEGFFVSNYKDIAKATGLHDRQVPHATINLENKGLVSTYLPDEKDFTIRCYRVNKNELDNILKDGEGNICSNIEDDYYWITYNKRLANKIGIIETVMLTDLYITYIDNKKKGKLIENIWMPLPQRRLAEQLNITRQSVVNEYFPKLKKTGFIQCKTMGWDNKTHVMLDEAKLATYLGLYELLAEYREETIVDKITQQIIIKARNYGEDWSDHYYEKAAIIEDRLDEGIQAKDLMELVDFVYEYYQRPNHIKYYNKGYFNFKYIFGKGRCKEQWVSLKNADYITKGLLFAIKKLSNGEEEWPLDDTKINIVRKQLDAGIPPEDILNKVINKLKATNNYNITFKSLILD